MSQKRHHESASQHGIADRGVALKKRRKYTEDHARLAAIYENLASEVSDERIRAAKDLVARLEPSSNPTPEAIETALTRLVRGLCSSRKAARFGFFVALTEILRLHTGDGGKTADELIDFVEQKTRPEGQSSRQVSSHIFSKYRREQNKTKTKTTLW
jgi:DNA polymerase phi